MFTFAVVQKEQNDLLVQWFFENLMMKVTLKERIFYQVVMPDISACFYFDIDPLREFIQAVFEEMAKEQLILNVEELWKTTVLLDALCNVKRSAQKIKHPWNMSWFDLFRQSHIHEGFCYPGKGPS